MTPFDRTACEFHGAQSPFASRGETLAVCGLCGCRFEGVFPVCGSCPISNGCDLIRCPNCGFQFPRGSRLVDALTRLWQTFWRTAS